MRLRLVPASGVPIYRQIVEQIGFQIARRRLRVGDRLPSVRELARMLPANQNTVIKAFDRLERDGLIVRKHGDGTYVAARGSPLNLAERRRRVGEVLEHAAVLARHLDLKPDELHKLLDEQVGRLPAEGDAQ